MAGAVLHQGAIVICAHSGQAMPASPQPRVLVSGQPVATIPPPYTIAGCPFTPANGGNGPCVTGQWVVGATRVQAVGEFLAIETGSAICAPTGTPLIVQTVQQRVVAS